MKIITYQLPIVAIILAVTWFYLDEIGPRGEYIIYSVASWGMFLLLVILKEHLDKRFKK